MIVKSNRSVVLCTVLMALFMGLALTASGLGQALDPALNSRLASQVRSDRMEFPGQEFIRKEIRANTFTASHQGSAALAMDAQGGFLVAWESRRQEDGSYGVYAQRFDPLGRRLGEEFRANLTLRSTQWQPAVAMDTEGGAWIGWESFGQDGSDFGCYARRFGGDLAPVSGEIRMNRHIPGNQSRFTCIPGPEGGLIAAWIGPDAGGIGRRAYVGRFTRTGDCMEEPILVDGSGERQEALVCLAGRRDGGFLAAWAALDGGGRPAGILARRFGPDGKPSAEPFRINEEGDAGAIEPGIASRPDGGFVAVWMTRVGNGADYRVKARLFGPEGEPGGPSFTVTAVEGAHQSGATVATAGDGRFCIAWNTILPAPDRVDIHAQLFDAKARPSSPAFRVNGYEKGAQALLAASGRRCLAFGPAGQLAFAWSGDSDLGDGSAANVTLLIPVPPKATADLDGNGRIDAMDVECFIDLLTGVCTDTTRYAAADLDRNGKVDASDLEGAFPAEDGAVALALEKGKQRLEAHRRALEEAAQVLQEERAAEKLAQEKARALQPDLVVRTDEAVPYEPPVQDPNFKPAGLFGGDPNPMGGRSDFGFQAITNTGWTPPDPHMAAGPNQLAAITNGAIAFFEKDGTKTFQDEIENSYGFWGSVGATNFVFDPEVIYDPHSGRFMAMAAERGPGSTSYFLLAVSDDSDPNGTWYKYRLNVTGMAGGDIDSPNLAVDQDVIYLTADFFTGGQKYLLYMLDKTPFLSGLPPGIRQHILITGSQSYGIPVVYGSAPAMYMIEHFESTTNTKVRLHAILDPLGTPQIQSVDLAVPGYSPPEWPPQQGTSTQIITFDSRFWSCVYRNGSLWAAHHQGQNRVLSRWYEIDMGDWPNSGTPALVQSGDIDPGPDIRTYFNSISVDAFGNALHCFARSSPNEYISIGRAFRKASDPLGTMQPMEIIKDSLVPYFSNRWGDYSAVVVDPTDNATFWYHHEYTSTGSWNTWIATRRVEDFPLSVDVTTLSESTGGTATFALLNPGHAGKDYLLLGTLSGTSPGVNLPGGLILPINWDLFTTVIILNLGSPFLNNFLGTLDGGGNGTAVFTAPALPGLAGATMDFAYAQDGKVWDFVSNSVSIQVVP